MSLKKNIKDLKKDLEKVKEEKDRKKNVEEVFKRFEAVRREHGYISEYEVLVEAGAIEAVEIPDEIYYNAGDLTPYIKLQRERVREALKVPENQEIIREAKLKAEQESIYYN